MRAAFAPWRRSALRRAKAQNRTKGKSRRDARRDRTKQKVARNGRPLAASCDGRGGVQPPVLAAVERGGVKPCEAGFAHVDSPLRVVTRAFATRFKSVRAACGAVAGSRFNSTM